MISFVMIDDDICGSTVTSPEDLVFEIDLKNLHDVIHVCSSDCASTTTLDVILLQRMPSRLLDM